MDERGFSNRCATIYCPSHELFSGLPITAKNEAGS